MKFSIKNSLALVLLAACTFTIKPEKLNASTIISQRHVLFLTANDSNSHKSQATYSNILASKPGNFSLTPLYVDLSTQEQTDNAVHWLSEYVKNQGSFDAVILCGDKIVDFITPIHDRLFNANTTFILAGVSNSENTELLQRRPHTETFSSAIYFDENVRLIKTLFPEIHNLVFLNRNNQNEDNFYRMIQSVTSRFDYQFDYKNISDLSKNQIASYVSRIPHESAIIMLSPEDDIPEIRSSIKETIDTIISNLPENGHKQIPVITCNDFGTEAGFLGGYYISAEAIGQAVGAALFNISSQWQQVTPSPAKLLSPEYHFDSQVLSSFDIQKSRVSADSVFFNDTAVNKTSIPQLVFGLIINLTLLSILLFYIIYSKHTENDLRKRIQEEKSKLNAVIDQSDTVCWEFDSNAAESKNNSFSDDAESKIDIAQGWIDSGIIDADYHDRFFKMINDLKNGKQFVTIDLPLTLEDVHTHLTNIRWKRIVYRAIKTVNGKTVTALGTATDITTQKRAEEQYEGMMSYRNFINKEYPAYTRLNLTSNIVMERMFNIPEFSQAIRGNLAEDELSLFGSILSCQGQNTGFAASFTRIDLLTSFINGTRKRECDFYYQFQNGVIHWYRLSIELTSNPHTSCIEAYISLKDITNEKVGLSSKDSVLNEEVEHIFWLDVSTSICRYIHRIDSPYIPLADELEYNDLKNFIIENVVAPKERERVENILHLKTLLDRIRDTGSINFTFEAASHDDEIIIKQEHIYSLNGNNNVIIFIGRDITDITLQEKLQNEKLSKAMKEAEKANSAKSDFLSRMSHDLRTPMNGIIGISELAEDEVNNPEAIREDLRKIKSSSKYMVGLLNDILDMSKIESGKMEIRPTETSVGEMVENICTLANAMCEKNRITFYCNINPQDYMDYIVNIDRLHSQQIIMNLLSNASKYTPAGGRIEFLIDTIATHDNLIDLKITVSDTGSGMTEEFQKVMYDAFTQDVNSVNKVGTGLGLAIVHNLVSLMNGTIECKSAPGEGTTFYITVSLEVISTGTKEEKDSTVNVQDQQEISLEGKKVLLVEDNELNQEIARRLLEKRGMIVTIAENGLIALNMYSETPPESFDVVLMDMMMPVMGGLESAKLLRSLDRDDAKKIPIIAMTANAFAEDIQKCLEVGMNTHVAKPIDPDLLISIIKKYLAEAQMA